MIVANVANSSNDEFYTPLYAIEPIAKYIKPNSTIWCPFDTEQSNFGKCWEEAQLLTIKEDNGDGIDI